MALTQRQVIITDVARYNADVRAVEDASYAHGLSDESPIFTNSVWDEVDGVERLKAIERRHGIKPDDLRVYSIASFKAEIVAIDEEFARTSPNADEWSVEARRRQARKADCHARHFRGLIRPRELAKVKNVETPSQLWAFVIFQKSIVCSLNDSSENSLRFANGAVLDSYSALLRFGFLDSVPRVPYPDLTWQESIDELTRIAVHLERLESERFRRELLEIDKQTSHAESLELVQNITDIGSLSNDAIPDLPLPPTEKPDPELELWKKSSPKQARLFEYMKLRESATCEEIGAHVHDDSQASDNTIRRNAMRTNESLEAMEIPIRFVVRSSRVIKERRT